MTIKATKATKAAAAKRLASARKLIREFDASFARATAFLEKYNKDLLRQKLNASKDEKGLKGEGQT